MNLDLPSAGHAVATIIGAVLLAAGFILCLFSSWSARDTWKSDMALWILGAAALQVAGVALLIIFKGPAQ